RILFTPDPSAGSGQTTISLGSALLRNSSDLPARSLSRRDQRSSHIWSCCRWGLPCHLHHWRRGALLPHHFTLAGGKDEGGRLKDENLRLSDSSFILPTSSFPLSGIFLLHFPSDCSASLLASTVPGVPADKSVGPAVRT